MNRVGPRTSSTISRAPARSSTLRTPRAVRPVPARARGHEAVGRWQRAEHPGIGEFREQREQHDDRGPAALDGAGERVGRGRGAEQGRRDAALGQRRREGDEREVVLLDRDAGQQHRRRSRRARGGRRAERSRRDVGEHVLDGHPVGQLGPPLAHRREHRPEHVLPGPVHRVGRQVVAHQAPARRAVEVQGGGREQVGHRVRLGRQVEPVLDGGEDDPDGLRGGQALADEPLHGAQPRDVLGAVAAVTARRRPAGAQPVAALPDPQGRRGQPGQPRHLGDGERAGRVTADRGHALHPGPPPLRGGRGVAQTWTEAGQQTVGRQYTAGAGCAQCSTAGPGAEGVRRATAAAPADEG